MIKKQITLINDFSGGEDTKTPIVSMGMNKSPNMRNWHCAGLGTRLIKRGGYSKINSSAVASDELDTYYPPGYQTYDYAVRDAVARTQISQGFIPKTSSTVSKVRLWLKKTGAPAGNINIEIQTDSSGVPSGTAVTNGTSANIDISTLTTSYAWYTFTFATQPSLTASTQYHIALQGDNAINGTAYASWGADDYDVVFPDGTMGVYNASTWAADAKYDAVFEVYIATGARGNDCFALWDFSSRSMMLGVWGTTLYKMDKDSDGTPDGTWDNLYNVDTEMDYMEYANDGAAQAAYVSSDTSTEPGAWDLLNEDCAAIGDWNDGDAVNGVSEVDPAGQFRMDANNAAAGNYASRDRDIGSYPNTFTAEIKLYHDAVGTYANNDWFLFECRQADERFEAYFCSDGLFINDTDTGLTEVGTNLVKQGGSAEWQTWRFLITFTGTTGEGTCDVYLTDSTHTAEKVGTAIPCSKEGVTTDGFTRIFQYGLTTNDMVTHIDYVKCSTGLTTPLANLQCYSEATIKQQGTYSLKGVAYITDSLNDTLTNTLGAAIDLSNQNILKFDIRASRTGSNIKVGIHDSGGTTTEHTINIAVADVFQTETWDISSVTNANKDDIDQIIITIVNADATNTFYVDNFYSATLLTTSRYWTFGDWQSGRALINADTGLYTYIGTGQVSAVAAAPLGKYFTIWKKYCFIAGIRGSPNQIRYSDLSDYTTWTASNTLNFDTNDGDVITGVRMLRGKMYVFKRYSVHRVSYLGSNPTFQVDQVLGIGCPSHYCVKEVDMGGEIGSVLIFPTTDKKLAIFDGYNIQIVHDTTTEKSNDLFAAADDQPLTFSDMDYTYADQFHAVVKSDSFEYILYCVLNGDTTINYAFVFDYKTGGIYPYDGQVFSSSLYMMSTDKSRILYCGGYTGYMWQMESGDDDDGSDINAYWVSPRVKPKAIGLANRLLLLGINYKEITSASTLNMNMKYRLDWNVSWLGSTNFSYDHNDELAFGKTALFDIGTIENMFQVKITDDSSNPAPTIYSLELHGEELGVDLGSRATS